ncbi:MAG TPA: hypothetical protein VM243_20895, partial [Phycisphaerae bacterium]|nr:hypothetical protein [Phycisphaerae bacterium]
MRLSHSRLATTIIVGLFVAAACTSAASPKPTTNAESASATAGTPSGTSSPTGRILFWRLYSTPDGNSEAALLSFDVATGEVLQAPWTLTEDPLGGLRWAPDGSGIIAAGYSGVDRFSGDSAEPIVVLPKQSGAYDAAFSPDGRWIAVAGGDGLGIAAADGGDGWEMVEPELGGARTAPLLAWSPDSRTVAFFSSDPSQSDPGLWVPSLTLLDRESRTTRVLAHVAPGVQGGLTWSPDGTQIAFLGEGPESELMNPELSGCVVCVANVESADVRSVVGDVSAVGGPWADRLDDRLTIAGWRDPRTIVAFRRGARPAAYQIDAESGDITEMTTPAVGVFFQGKFPPDLSPDGRWLAISFARAEGATYIGLFDLDLGIVEQITSADASSYDRDLLPMWQPAPLALPWQLWAAPTPEPTPTNYAGTGHLEVSGAVQASVDVAGTCSAREDGVGLYMERDGTVVQIGMTSGGAITFLEVFLDDFEAFAGKGFEARPPWVVAELGAGPTEGELTFHDLP